MIRHIWLLLLPIWLVGCDQLSERAGFPNAAKLEADGKAIGGACRHAGRGLEDCFRLNKGASKAAIYAGWKEMNEYMAKNNMQTVEPNVTPFSMEADKKQQGEEESHGGKTATGDKAATGEKSATGDKTEKTDKTEKADKPEKADKTEKTGEKKTAKNSGH